MVDVTWVEHHGVIAEGHDLDPDEALAAAGLALTEDTDLNPLARRHAVPITALPQEAWYHPDGGIVQETYPGARPVTVVNVEGDLATAAADRASRAGKPIERAKPKPVRVREGGASGR